MSGSRVNVSMTGLESTIKKALDDTKNLTEEALKTAIDKTSKETVAKIKGAAPVRTGAYAKNWTSKVTLKPGRGGYGRTVYNVEHYRRAHLLQNGHGGPILARPYPHIPSDEETEELLEKNLESEMLKG